jgi:hypothetical protein
VIFGDRVAVEARGALQESDRPPQIALCFISDNALPDLQQQV